MHSLLLRRIGETTAVCLLLLGLGTNGALAGPGAALDSVSPSTQRVHEMITLRGSGFGSYVAGTSQIIFRTGPGETPIPVDTPYVWRDDFIQLRVPVGYLDGGTPLPIPLAMVTMSGTTS